MNEVYNKFVLDKIKRRTIVDSNGCWLRKGWPANIKPTMSYMGKNWWLSRLILYLTDSSFDRAKQANHKCKNECCFNPEHLYCGTQSQNRRDSVVAGTWKNQHSKRTHCPKCGGDYKYRKDGVRYCHPCSMEAQRIRRLMK